MNKQANNHSYSAELRSDYPEWSRYDLFMTMASYDNQDNRIGYQILRDDENGMSENRTPRQSTINSMPCNHIELYVYAIANSFPSSPIVRDTPCFDAELIITCDGQIIERSVHSVNPWGGLTIAAHTVRR